MKYMCNDNRAYLIYVYIMVVTHDILDSEHVTRLIIKNKKETDILN